MTFRGAVAQRDSRRPCASGRGGHSCHGSRRRALASRCSSVFFTIAVGILALTDAFCASSPHRIHAHSSQRRSTRQRGATADTTNANIDTAVQILPAQSSPDYALQAIRADLQNRMRTAPAPLEDNEVSRRHAESSIAERFEVDSEGSLVGGIQAEIRLARALALDAVVIVRATSLDMRASLAALSGAAENLLGDARTAQEKLDEYGAMRDYEEGVVSGYAGGGGYGLDQFLETRGKGEGKIAPNIDGDIAPVVLAGRRALSTISSGILRAVVRQSLPDVDGDDFMELVDPGEGGKGTGKGDMSCTPLRMCRYADDAGVAFGAHTDTTFLTVIPCASAPGLEILQPSTGRWLRPEAAGDCEAGSDVMLLAGELLQVLGQGQYKAAVHRVVRPAGLPDPRVSTPLLVRGKSSVSISHKMLPEEVTAILKAAPEDGVASDAGAQLSMKDLWAALQFRGGITRDDKMLEPAEDAIAVRIDDTLDTTDNDDDLLARSFLKGEEHEILKCFEQFCPCEVSVLSVEPLLIQLHGFASVGECAAIMDQARESMAASTTWGGTDAQDESNATRSSTTTWVPDGSLRFLEDFTARVSGISGLPLNFMEKWQVARYKTGGYFKLHTDHVDTFNDLVCGGRVGTLMIYLNDLFEGGETEFPNLNVLVEPSVGDALFFHNVKVPLRREDAHKMVADDRSAHAGLPVTKREKWIATKWVHPVPYPNGQ